MPGSVSKWILEQSRGDETAVNDIYTQYRPRVLAKARRLLREEPLDCDEEDLTQSVFRTALRHFGSVSQNSKRPVTSVSLWRYLETCLFHKLVDRRRRAAATKRLPVADQQVSLDKLWDDRPTASVQVELQDDINYLLRLLDVRSRQILLLALDGHENEDIARHVGVSPRTVQRKLVLIRDAWLRLCDKEPSGNPPSRFHLPHPQEAIRK